MTVLLCLLNSWNCRPQVTTNTMHNVNTYWAVVVGESYKLAGRAGRWSYKT